MTLQPLYRTEQIRAIEQAHSNSGLMEKAGLAAAELTRALLSDSAYDILVLAGPGNNGGDALVAARHLKHDWHRVDVVFTGDPDHLPPEAAAALESWLACGGELLTEIPPGSNYALIIDGLFGIGISRPLDARHCTLIEAANAQPGTRLALDVPSGLCADTGRVFGCAFNADHTLTFLGLKPGLFTLDGPDHSGMVHVTDLGVEDYDTEEATGWLIEAPPALPAIRRRNSHKGSHGSVGVLGGDASMTGAALLAARAALLTGAGRVYAGLLTEHAPAVDFGQPELMLRSPKALLDCNHLTALVVGPGLGHTSHAEAVLQRAIHYPAPLLLDADALNLLAEHQELRSQFCARTDGNIITPHPGEAAGLLDTSVTELQADRIGAAQRLAREFNAITVLKGCGSVIATPDGRWYINGSGNPGLASAGMGDVLCGMIASLLGQGLAPEAATLLGVYLHGAAADQLVAEHTGPLGLTASEVALAARSLLNHWLQPSP